MSVVYILYGEKFEPVFYSLEKQKVSHILVRWNNTNMSQERNSQIFKDDFYGI